MARLLRAMNLTRRFVLTALFFVSGTAVGRASGMRRVSPERQRSAEALRRVTRWGCQYQNVDLGAITRSDLDLIVIDPSLDDRALRFVTKAECEALKTKAGGARRIVLAYLSIGEADTKRWHWPAAWLRSEPDWLGPENPKWPGSRSVQYWNSEWRDLVYNGDHSILDLILDAGFDGVFLDRADAYGDWLGEPGALDAMAELVFELGAKARARDPSFILMLQNAEALLRHENLASAIDAHSKESLLTGLNGADTRNTPEDVAWSLGYLRGLQEIGVPTFAAEYISDQALCSDVEPRLTELGFVPFFATTNLDRLPGAACAAEY